jgi:hypothetical protein
MASAQRREPESPEHGSRLSVLAMQDSSYSWKVWPTLQEIHPRGFCFNVSACRCNGFANRVTFSMARDADARGTVPEEPRVTEP